MHVSRRLTIVLTALVTTLTLGVLGVLGAVFIALDRTPAPSIAPMASADSAGGGGGGYTDPWAAHAQRCDPVMQETWGPSEADLVQIREENERLAAALDEAGVAYELIVEEGEGWEDLVPVDGDHEAFERVLEEFWSSGEQEPNEHELTELREENEALAAHLDERGVAYEIMTEPGGWEHVEPVDDDGWKAMEEFWHEQERENLRQRAAEQGLDVDLVLDCFDEARELSSTYDGFENFPFPMDMRMASEQKAMIEDLMAAFDEAGIAYQRLDVPFLQWDRDDEAAADIVEQVTGQHGWGVEMAEEEAMMEEVIVEREATEAG